MHAELAERIALVSHGQALLRRRAAPQPGGLASACSALADCRTLRFSWDERLVADSPESWIEHLRAAGASRLWLMVADPTTGARPWGICAELAGGAQLWTGQRAPAEEGGWLVDYHGAALMGEADRGPSLGEAQARLTRALQDARAFSDDNGERWSIWFNESLAMLAATTPPDFPHYRDLFPSGWDPEARKMAAAAATSWVFGTQASFTDMAFADRAVRERYERVCVELQGAVVGALVAAANVG